MNDLKVQPTPLSGLDQPDQCITVLYGHAGKRKTTTAVGLIKEKGLIVSADGSWQVLLKPAHQALRAKADFVHYQGLSQFRYIDYTPYDTIILDTWSDMVDSYLDLLADNVSWGNKDEIMQTKDPTLKGTRVIGREDWRVCRDKWRPVVNDLIKTGKHLIFTAHVNSPIKGLTADTTLKPAIPDATWQLVNRRSNVIAYMHPEGTNIYADMRETNKHCISKSQRNGLQGNLPTTKFIEAYRTHILGETA